MSEFLRRYGPVRKLTVATLGAIVLVLAACSQDDGEATVSSELPATTVTDSTVIDAGSAARLSPAEFEDIIAAGDAIVLNVHVPYEGHIEGTDAFIPFDEIASSPLPDDMNQPIALYCRSGNMSATATRTLVEMGYTDVVDLAGGMNAWVETGRPLEESIEN
jgi:rhodanese-related sulfurtransferase